MLLVQLSVNQICKWNVNILNDNWMCVERNDDELRWYNERNWCNVQSVNFCVVCKINVSGNADILWVNTMLCVGGTSQVYWVWEDVELKIHKLEKISFFFPPASIKNRKSLVNCLEIKGSAVLLIIFFTDKRLQRSERFWITKFSRSCSNLKCWDFARIVDCFPRNRVRSSSRLLCPAIHPIFNLHQLHWKVVKWKF